MGEPSEKTINHSFSLGKFGLEPDEFKGALSNKLDTMKIEKMKHSDLSTSVELCIKTVCIRPKSTKPEELDKRRHGNLLYKRVLLEYEKQHRDAKAAKKKKKKKEATGEVQPVKNLIQQSASPKKLVEETSGHQGIDLHHKTINKLYHDDQDTLITKLKELLNEDHTPRADSFCDEVDAYSEKLMGFYVGILDCSNELPSDDDLVLLCKILNLCENVVMGRQVADWELENDLMSSDGWESWKDHVHVMLSFAALLTILLMIFKNLKEIKKFKEVVESHEELKLRIGQVFNIYSWQWPHMHCEIQSDHPDLSCSFYKVLLLEAFHVIGILGLCLYTKA